MTTEMLEAAKSYDPNRLLDRLKEILELDSDLALSQVLEVPAPLIGQIRHRGFPISPSILIRMHELTNVSVRELRQMMGDRRKSIRTSYDPNFLGDTAPVARLKMVHDDGAQRYFYLVSAALFIYAVWSTIL